MIEIFIDNNRIDLFTKDAIALTKQINDIAEIRKRQADYTNRFSIPKTPNNMAIAEMLNVVGNTSTKPYKYSNASIISNGITITDSGIALIQETKNRQAYDVIIYAGNYDLYSRIKDKYITDLDWSDLEHLFDKYAYQANSVVTTIEDYIYPILETLDGRLTKTTTSLLRVDLNYQVPCVFVKAIWRRIFEEAGLEYSGDFFTDNETYNKEVVPACRNWAKDITDPLDFFKGNNPLEPNAEISAGTDSIVNHIVWANTNISPSPNFSTATGKYTVPEDGTYLFTLRSRLAISYLHIQQFRVTINGVVSGTFSRAELNIELVFGVLIRETNLQLEHQLRTGDVIEFFTDFYDGGPINATELEITNYELEIQQTKREPIAYDSVIDFSKWLPKIKQIDFLKAIMQQYGLIYQRDATGKIKFITIDELLNKVGGISDYTKKLHAENSETYRIGSFFKNNYFRYEYHESDRIGTDYADSSFPIDIDDLEEEGDLVDSIIQASGDWLLFDGWEKIASIHAYRNSESDVTKPPIFTINDNNKLQTIVLDAAPTEAIQIYDSLSDTVLEDLIYSADTLAVGKFLPLHWETLKTEYYSKYITTVQKPVSKKVSLWLTPIDIYFLDMFKVVYLEQYQSFFYLNKVSNFQAGKLSECELIKIN